MKATGVLLAGGQSRRFGSDKAWAELCGRPLLYWVAAALAAECDSVVVAKAQGQELPPLELAKPVRYVEDSYPARGPLAGLVSAFPLVETEYAVVASVDVPLLSPAVVRVLAEQVRRHDVALPVVDGRQQPLAAAYRVATCLPQFERTLLEGEGSVRAAIEGLDVHLVDEAALREVDPQLVSFRNANTPEALAELARLITVG